MNCDQSAVRRVPTAYRPSLIALLALLAACSGDGDGGGRPAVDRIEIAAPRTVIGVNETVKLAATARDASGNELKDVSFRWESSVPASASVDAAGEVRGVSAGATLVKAYAEGADGSLGIVVSPTPQPTAVVDMPGDTFAPARVEIRVNERVAFVFPARPHNVIFDRTRTGAPTDIQVTSNQIVQRQFTAAGSFKYDCTLHPGMTGEVVVR